MDIMDFLALEETDIEEVKRMNAKECQNSADMFQGGTRIVRQPTAVSAAYGMGAGAPGQGRERRLTSQTAVTGVSECTQGPENAFSDFVKMTQYKPLTKLTKREAFWPIMSGGFPSGADFTLPADSVLANDSIDPVLPMGICVSLATRVDVMLLLIRACV